MTKLIFFFILLINACTSHKSYLTNNNLENTSSLVVINDKKNVVYIAQEKNLPSFLKITRSEEHTSELQSH